MLNLRISAVGTLAALLLVAPEGRGSTWQLVTVAQPICLESIVWSVDVPFGFDVFHYGSEVELTCRSNSIHMVGEEVEKPFEDLNVASRYGLSLKIDRFLDLVQPDAMDTLTVTLDASRIESRVGQYVSADSVVAATVYCARINATRTRNLDFLKIRVRGSKRYQAFAGVYKVEAMPMRSFNLNKLPAN